MEANQLPVILIGLVAGLFTIICAAKDYDWFIENRKTWLLIKLIGRDGTRIFYVLLGILIIVLGFLCNK